METTAMKDPSSRSLNTNTNVAGAENQHCDKIGGQPRHTAFGAAFGAAGQLWPTVIAAA